MDEDSPDGENHVSEAMEKAKEVLGSPLYEESKFSLIFIHFTILMILFL